MKLIEAKQAKEFAQTYLADPVLRMAVNAVVDNCPEFEQGKQDPRPRTNADRIRAMTDKELAWFLAERYAKANVLRLADEGHEPTATEIKVLTEMLYRTWMRWLRHPVEVE